MKQLSTLIIIFMSALQICAQISSDVNHNKFAIVNLYKSPFGRYDFNLYLEKNKQFNLFKTLQLDTLKFPEDDDPTNAYILMGLNFMNNEGYELITSSMTNYAHGGTVREYVFLKKGNSK